MVKSIRVCVNIRGHKSSITEPRARADEYALSDVRWMNRLDCSSLPSEPEVLRGAESQGHKQNVIHSTITSGLAPVIQDVHDDVAYRVPYPTVIGIDNDLSSINIG